MAKHLKTGKIGEQLAADYFLKLGYGILHQNWRYKHWEIDIIAEKSAILHFIEVKTKTTDNYGFPEDAVTPSKIKYLMNAGEEFLYQNPDWERIQFDILAIILKPEIKIFLIEDVYL